VIQDYDLRGNHLEVIDEFPFFSFLLGDLHPHVLAIPFGLLAVASALHLFLGGWRGEIQLPLGLKLHITSPGFLFSAVLLGGLAFLNTWDILIAAALLVGAYVFWRARENGWNWERLEDLFLLGLPLGFFSILLYFPFYLGFSSQAGGLLPNLMYITRGAHLWVMWGTLLIPIFAYLIRAQKLMENPNWKLAFFLGLGFTLLLWALSWLLGWIAAFVDPGFAQTFLQSQGVTASQLFAAASLRRLAHIASLVTLLAVLIPAFACLFPKSPIPAYQLPASNQFVLLLLALGGVLVLAPEFVYLRDQFGYRINTIFKFYYQAWMLWSLAAAFAVAWLFQNLRPFWNAAFRILTALVIFAGLLYPVLGLTTKTQNFNPPFGFTLDDFDRLRRENPDEAAALEFLQTVPNGVVAEAVGGSYQSEYARVAAYTGLQTVLGWPGHESQWRGGAEPQGTRSEDIFNLYVTPHWDTAKAVMDRYDIRYIFVGATEYASMPVKEEKFRAHLKIIFQQGSVTVYEAP
jgi:YYY domain-containing protein